MIIYINIIVVITAMITHLRGNTESAIFWVLVAIFMTLLDIS